MIRILIAGMTLFLFPMTFSFAQTDLSPLKWGEEELKKYVRLKRIAEPVTKSRCAMVTGTSSSIAIRAGLEALKQGGSTVDAALACALTHVTLAGGCTVSFAGVLTMVHYDAASKRVYALDGGYNTVLGEKDPLTIPRATGSDPAQQGKPPMPKGRTVLVPGFMAGVEAAHKRFGKLPFPEIFKPAIYFAENGFPISPALSHILENSRALFSRVPETKATLYKENGDHYKPGEIFKQPALAKSLRLAAQKGTQAFYQGAWAEKFVKAVRKDGGKITMEDMKKYNAKWVKPLNASYGGLDFYLFPGGRKLAGMLNMLEISNLKGKPHYTQSPETLYWFCKIIKGVSFREGLGGLAIHPDQWVNKDKVKLAWETLKNNPHHSDAIVVMDKEGNMTALLHSSNTTRTGETGLYINGFSIPDSATFQQLAVAAVEPGQRLFNPTAPLIALKDNQPILGMSAIGSGIYEECVKCIFNMVGYGQSVQEAIDGPSIVPFFGDGVDSPSISIAVSEEAYSRELLDKAIQLGLKIKIVSSKQARRRKGAVAAIAVDPATGIREGGSVRRFSLGY